MSLSSGDMVPLGGSTWCGCGDMSLLWVVPGVVAAGGLVCSGDSSPSAFPLWSSSGTMLGDGTCDDFIFLFSLFAVFPFTHMPSMALPDQRASLLSSDSFSGLLFFLDFMSLMEDILCGVFFCSF